MNPLKIAAIASLALAASCASSPVLSSGSSADSYEAKRQADGAIEIVVTARSERLASSSGSVSLGLTDLLEQAAAKECDGAFELEQDPSPTSKVSDGRLIATLRGLARCK
ncbi:hypothetical protein LY625_12435 [Lysobacter sp. GX 14042]|uniref:hypothetical protein n=1 Tax=Lysobacter sp. GX 14042 TaxID=2907155 RepID=UPI001F2219F3|nr:hypothetical protein [Lysobacter sp. GX 14042]MCE7033409.1 hypothetical protein [Lysobacter sp. GX 14042]